MTKKKTFSEKKKSLSGNKTLPKNKFIKTVTHTHIMFSENCKKLKIKILKQNKKKTAWCGCFSIEQGK